MEKLKKLMLFAVFLFIVSGCRKNDAWDIPTQETNTAARPATDIMTSDCLTR
jgi:hypothetical protein